MSEEASAAIEPGAAPAGGELEAVAEAHDLLRDRVAAARASGRSWKRIGAVLGVPSHIAERLYGERAAPFSGELEGYLVKSFREHLPEGFTRMDASTVAAAMAPEVAGYLDWPEAQVRRQLQGALKAAVDSHGIGPELVNAAAKRARGSFYAAGLWRRGS